VVVSVTYAHEGCSDSEPEPAAATCIPVNARKITIETTLAQPNGMAENADSNLGWLPLMKMSALSLAVVCCRRHVDGTRTDRTCGIFSIFYFLLVLNRPEFHMNFPNFGTILLCSEVSIALVNVKSANNKTRAAHNAMKEDQHTNTFIITYGLTITLGTQWSVSLLFDLCTSHCIMIMQACYAYRLHISIGASQ
jgi:hypothetical protein